MAFDSSIFLWLGRCISVSRYLAFKPIGYLVDTVILIRSLRRVQFPGSVRE